MALTLTRATGPDVLRAEPHPSAEPQARTPSSTATPAELDRNWSASSQVSAWFRVAEDRGFEPLRAFTQHAF